MQRKRIALDPAAEWAGRIAAAWQKSVTAIIAVGQLLLDARAALGNGGAFGRMIGRDGNKPLLPFGYRTVYRLMAIASDQRLVTHGSLMPPCWRTLSEIAGLSDREFAFGIERNLIHPDMERADVKTIVDCTHAESMRARQMQWDILDPNAASETETEAESKDPPVAGAWVKACKTSEGLADYLETIPADDVDKWRVILTSIRAACDAGLDVIDRPAEVQLQKVA
jgi:hypothetical protein